MLISPLFGLCDPLTFYCLQ